MSVNNLNDFLVVDVIFCRPTLHYLLFDLKNMHMKGVRVKMLTVLYLLFILASLSHLFRVQGYPCCKVCHEKTQTGVDIAFKVPYQLIASLFDSSHSTHTNVYI